jgi:DNA ligase (NAD+)
MNIENKKKINKEIIQLEHEILKHRSLYYRGLPVISDYEFDQLERKLETLNKESYVFKMVGSIDSKSEKIKHNTKMLSLEKTYSIEELEKWIGENEVISAHKIDGLSCSLIYKNGELITAKTRGDGEFGEDITEKVKWINTIPKSINTIKLKGINNSEWEVRGEIYCNEENFLVLAAEMESLKLNKPSSLRNISAGLISRKDHLYLCQHLSFFAFELITPSNLNLDIKNEWDKVNLLKNLNFELPNMHLHHNYGSHILKSIKESEKFFQDGEFPIDGVVFSYNNLDYQKELGSTTHHPRFKIAFKFQGVAKETRINSIQWNVSRRGILTPVAHIEPIRLSNANISRVTLHNYGIVKSFNLKNGDIIEVIRSGEVIPKFSRLVQSSNNDFLIPKKCPQCEGPVIIEEIRLICHNSNCNGRKLEEILDFVKKIGIDDLSESRIQEMINKNLITSIPDIYSLEIKNLLTLDNFKEKIASKIFNNIQKSKSTTLDSFLAALGITGIAINKSKRIIDAGFNTLSKLKIMNLNDLLSIEGFAEKSAQDFLQSLKSKMNTINQLMDAGFTIIDEYPIDNFNSSNPLKFKNITFCITGKLSQERGILEKYIRNHGGKVSSAVSSKTNYVVTNDPFFISEKMSRAKELGTPIISENDLLELFENN